MSLRPSRATLEIALEIQFEYLFFKKDFLNFYFICLALSVHHVYAMATEVRRRCQKTTMQVLEFQARSSVRIASALTC